MAMNSPEAAVDALQESLRHINDDIIANEAQYATLQNIINDDLQPLVVAAREAFREAPHGTADQRHARAALKEELDDSRSEVENAKFQLNSLESRINELKTRRDNVTAQIASTLAEAARVGGPGLPGLLPQAAPLAPMPQAPQAVANSFSMTYDEKSWKLYIGTKTAQQQAIATEWRKEADPMELINQIIACVESPHRTLPLDHSSWYSYRHEQPIGAHGTCDSGTTWTTPHTYGCAASFHPITRRCSNLHPTSQGHFHSRL